MSAFTDLLDQIGVTGHWPLDETSGTVAADRKGLHHGVYAGTGGVHGPSMTPGLGAGHSLKTNATAYVTVADPGDIHPTGGSFAGGCTVRFDALPTSVPANDWMTIFAKKNNGPYFVVNKDGTLFIQWWDGTAQQSVYVQNVIDVGVPYFLGFDMDATTGRTRIFVNDELMASALVPLVSSIYSVYEMGWGGDPVSGHILNGAIDECWMKIGAPPTAPQWAQMYEVSHYPPYVSVPWTPDRNTQIAIGSHAAFLDPAETVRRYDRVVVQHWRTDALAAIKDADPTCVVLAYQNFGHITEGSTEAQSSSGLSEEAALEEHFGHDSEGERIFNPSYPYIFYGNPASPTYADAWADGAILRATSGGFDGVFIDDANNSPASMDEGEIVEFPTDDAYFAASTTCLSTISTRLRAEDLKICANIGGWHADRVRYETWMPFFDMAFCENAIRYTGNGVFAYDGHVASALLLAMYAQKWGVEPWINVPTNDDEPLVGEYAKALALVVSDGRCHIATPTLPVNYDTAGWIEDYFIALDALGSPIGTRTQPQPELHQRRFRKGIVLVNGADEPAEYTVNLVGGPYYDGRKKVRSPVTLPIKSGLILTTEPRTMATSRTIPYDAPHFAYPFQRGEHGKVNLVEQATPEHVQGQMYAVAVTPMGYRDARPDFGWEFPEFRSVPLDISGLADAFARLVPDQPFNLEEWPDVVSEAIRHISVTPVLSGEGVAYSSAGRED